MARDRRKRNKAMDKSFTKRITAFALILALAFVIFVSGMALTAKAAGNCWSYIGGSVYAYYYATGTTCTNGQEQITRFYNNSSSGSRTVSYRGVNYFMAPKQSSFNPNDPYAVRQCGSVVGYGSWCIG